MAAHAWAAGPRKRSREDDYEDAAMGGVSGFSEHRTVSRLSLLSWKDHLTYPASSREYLYMSSPPFLPRLLLLTDTSPSDPVMSPTFDSLMGC